MDEALGTQGLSSSNVLCSVECYIVTEADSSFLHYLSLNLYHIQLEGRNTTVRVVFADYDLHAAGQRCVSKGKLGLVARFALNEDYMLSIVSVPSDYMGYRTFQRIDLMQDRKTVPNELMDPDRIWLDKEEAHEIILCQRCSYECQLPLLHCAQLL